MTFQAISSKPHVDMNMHLLTYLYIFRGSYTV